MKLGLVRKFVRRFAIGIGVLVAVFAVFILEENVRGRILLAHYKAQLRARGEKLTLVELNLPKPAKESKSATDTLLMEGYELAELSKRSPFPVYSISGLRFVQPGCCVVRCAQPDSGLKLSMVNAGINRASGGRFRAHEEAPPERPPVQLCGWEQFAEQVSLARERIGEARAALRQPGLGVPIDYSQGFKAPAPQDNAVASIATWLAATAFDDLRQNKLDNALEDIVGIAALMRFLQNDCFVGSQLVRARTGERGLDTTWEALQAEGWTDERLAKLQMTWEQASVINEFEPAMEVELVASLDEWQKVHRTPIRQLLIDYAPGEWSWKNFRLLLVGMTWRLAWELQDEARCLRLLQNEIVNARTGVSSRAWTVARAHFEQTQREERQHTYNFYDRWRYQLSTPDFASGFAMFPNGYVYGIQWLLEYETRREMTMAAIALKRFELRHGRLPPDLVALVPELLTEIPRDYMNSDRLHYRLNSEGSWVLYSVGDNGVDDGGDPTPLEPRNSLRSIWDGRDAVWPQPASAN